MNFGGWEVHVVPMRDQRPHVTIACTCWCSPTVNENGAIVHNALDGREPFEEGKRKPS